MTITLQSNRTITSWINADLSFTLDGNVYSPEETEKLRDYLVNRLTLTGSEPTA